ncbi:MAG TPA: alcohol dehydrogenase, partial [Pantoea sp.]|nr:alcohol dehydrogenase [Pantoea sp.]
MKKTTLAGGAVVIAAIIAAGLLWQNGDTSADDVADNQTLTGQPPAAADAAAVARGRYV